MRILIWVAGVLGALVVGVLVAARSDALLRSIELKFFNPGLTSKGTPADLGIAFERVAIASGERKLDALIVRADASCPNKTALLLVHGSGETVADWMKVQAFLKTHCISSLVFDYAGHGASSPHGSIGHMGEDTAAAYAAFVADFPDQRRCVLSHSFGAGPLLEIDWTSTPVPDCIVLANAFTSMKDISVFHGAWPILVSFFADIWDNEINVAKVRSPILIVSSHGDTSVPFAMGERLFAAAPKPKAFAPLDGFEHNDLYVAPSEKWWATPIAFISGVPQK
jgi:alpha-beta hydrolase superfamily lysophospholipase